MNNDDFDLDIELAKSIEKLVDEETTVARAFVDRNSLKNNKNDNSGMHSTYSYDKSKTQAIPNIPSRYVDLENENDINSEDLIEEGFIEENIVKKNTNKDMSKNSTIPPNKNNKMDKKTKLIIASVVSVVILAVIAIIVISVILNNNKKNSFDYNYTEGIKYYNSKEYDKALNFLEKAVQLSKKNIDLRFKIYDCYVAVEKNDKAVGMLKDILSYEKNNEKALISLASNYSKNKEGDKLTALIRSYDGTEGYKFLANFIVVEPTTSKVAGSFTEAIDVELKASETDIIYYTIDGSEPTTKSILYSEAIHLTKGVTSVKAIAVNSIGTTSKMVEKKYTIDYKAPDAPIVTPLTGSYEEGKKISITNLKEGDTAYYTTDGSTPTTSSTKYNEEFNMPIGNTSFYIIIVSQYGLESSVTSRNYNVVAAKTYSYEEALALLKVKMKSVGDMKADGTTPDGKTPNFVYYKKVTISDAEIYLIEYRIGTTSQKYYFGVASKTGLCYKVIEKDKTYTATEY